MTTGRGGFVLSCCACAVLVMLSPRLKSQDGVKGSAADSPPRAPIVFAEGYVTQRDWWRVGFAMSVLNLAVWTTVGFAWWKVVGFW